MTKLQRHYDHFETAPPFPVPLSAGGWAALGSIDGHELWQLDCDTVDDIEPA